jgi:CRISPR-associated protein Cas8a1/Csx13
MELIQQDDMWDRPEDRLFVQAFWQALASLYRQEVEGLRRGGSRSVKERLNDLNDSIRRELTQAKTRTLVRDALAQLLARAGRQRTLREHPAVIWRLIDQDWKKGRDLALLALASYQGKKKQAGEGTAKAGKEE